MLDADPDAVVGDILQNMLDKDLVQDHVKRDLGLREKEPPDPRTKMALRHQQVVHTRQLCSFCCFVLFPANFLPLVVDFASDFWFL